MPDRNGQPPEQPSPRDCGSCRGDGGHAVRTTKGGKTLHVWESCKPCHGTGVQGGGV